MFGLDKLLIAPLEMTRKEIAFNSAGKFNTTISGNVECSHAEAIHKEAPKVQNIYLSDDTGRAQGGMALDVYLLFMHSFSRT